MSKREYSRPLYGSVHVYDYEHSGDSRQAYNVLARFGITDTTFQNNGDGNVAFIEFTMEYKTYDQCKRLQDALENAGYGCGFVNMWDYHRPPSSFALVADAGILPAHDMTDKSEQPLVEAVTFYKDIEDKRLTDWTCFVRWTEWRSAVNRDPSVLLKVLELLKMLGATEVYFSEGRDQISIRANVPFSKIKEHRYSLDAEGVGRNVLILPWRSYRDRIWVEETYDMYGMHYIRYNVEHYKFSRFGCVADKLGGF